MARSFAFGRFGSWLATLTLLVQVLAATPFAHARAPANDDLTALGAAIGQTVTICEHATGDGSSTPADDQAAAHDCCTFCQTLHAGYSPPDDRGFLVAPIRSPIVLAAAIDRGVRQPNDWLGARQRARGPPALS